MRRHYSRIMEAKIIHNFPGPKQRSQAWNHFGFYAKTDTDQGKRNVTKADLDMEFVICKICRKRYAYKGEFSHPGHVRNFMTFDRAEARQ
jgi:hypothetical protein